MSQSFLRGAGRIGRTRGIGPTPMLALCRCALALAGCLGPPLLHQQVMADDEVMRKLDEKLLLVNIARLENEQSSHFTSTSSIAATFDWTTTIGAGGQIEELPGTKAGIHLTARLGSRFRRNDGQLSPDGNRFLKSPLA